MYEVCWLNIVSIMFHKWNCNTADWFNFYAYISWIRNKLTFKIENSEFAYKFVRIHNSKNNQFYDMIIYLYTCIILTSTRCHGVVTPFKLQMTNFLKTSCYHFKNKLDFRNRKQHTVQERDWATVFMYFAHLFELVLLSAHLLIGRQYINVLCTSAWTVVYFLFELWPWMK